jgi:hypothetical protein
VQRVRDRPALRIEHAAPWNDVHSDTISVHSV